MTLGFWVILLIGFSLGWIIRGSLTKKRIINLKDTLKEERIQTMIDAERHKQDRMIEERINN